MSEQRSVSERRQRCKCGHSKHCHGNGRTSCAWCPCEGFERRQDESPPPSRIGPTEPDDTMVICPVCTSQFRAIPLDVQRVRDELLAVAKRYAAECRLCGGHGVRRRLDLDGTPLDDVSCEQCADVRLAIARAEGRSDG